jgi:hypothetical protein
LTLREIVKGIKVSVAKTEVIDVDKVSVHGKNIIDNDYTSAHQTEASRGVRC